MPGAQELRRRRRNLMAVSPYCDECGQEVFEYELSPGQKVPPNQATIQHVNSRIRYPGGRPRHGVRILMCYQCNQEDGRREYEEAKRERERQELMARVLPPDSVPRPRRRKRL